jgi:S1-C subfamily serine protease
MLGPMTKLSDLSDELADAVAGASAAIVHLRGTRFPACGTAWTENLAVTVAHVLGGSDRGHVVLPSGEDAKAEVVGRDRSTDLALLKIDAELGVPRWTDDVPRVGHLVLALGLGRGDANRATLGMVSGVSGGWKTRAGGEIDSYIEVDGTLPPGFSGGPLVSAGGQLVGINSHRLLRSGVTIPTTTVRRVVEHLSEHGGFRRGYLGVGVQPVGLPKATADELGRARGVLVISVAAEGPAERAGVLLGDVLLEIDGVALEGMEDLLAALSTRANAEVALKLLRAGQAQAVDVAIGER